MANKGKQQDKERGGLLRVTQDYKPEGNSKTLTIVPHTKIITVAGRNIRVTQDYKPGGNSKTLTGEHLRVTQDYKPEGKGKILTGEIPRVTQDNKREGKGKIVTIVPHTKIITVAGRNIRVPNAIEIVKESDLKPELVIVGPVKKQIGGQTLSCYVTVDGQKARFDAKGNLV